MRKDSLNVEEMTETQVQDKIRQASSRIKISLEIMTVLAAVLAVNMIMVTARTAASTVKISLEIMTVLAAVLAVTMIMLTYQASGNLFVISILTISTDLSLLAFCMGTLAYYTGNLRYLKTEQRIRKLWNRLSERE